MLFAADHSTLLDPSQITVYNEMRLGSAEKILSAKYLFLVENNIRNRLNILKAFKKLLKEL